MIKVEEHNVVLEGNAITLFFELAIAIRGLRDCYAGKLPDELIEREIADSVKFSKMTEAELDAYREELPHVHG
jgi:hypothetical protein